MKSRRQPLPVLFIVDVQAAFDIPPAFVERLRRYSRRFPRRVFTRFVNPRGSLFRRKLKQRCCTPGSDDCRLLIEPGPRDRVIAKSGYGLPEREVRRLKRAGIREALVCGVDTDACVLGVMFSLFDAGISPRASDQHCWSSSGLQRPAMRIIEEQFPTRR